MIFRKKKSSLPLFITLLCLLNDKGLFAGRVSILFCSASLVLTNKETIPPQTPPPSTNLPKEGRGTPAANNIISCLKEISWPVCTIVFTQHEVKKKKNNNWPSREILIVAAISFFILPVRVRTCVYVKVSKYVRLCRSVICAFLFKQTEWRNS